MIAPVKLLDTNHPFFRPLWVRVAVTAIAGGWTVFEFVAGEPFWGVIFLAFTALSVWGFFIDFNPDDQEQS